MMNSPEKLQQWRFAIAADCRDTYFSWAKYLVVPFLTIYLVLILVVRGTTVPLAGSNDVLNRTHGAASRYLYTAPEGLRFHLSEPMTDWKLLLHWLAGAFLIPFTLLQKHSAPYLLKAVLMRLSKKTDDDDGGKGGDNKNKNKDEEDEEDEETEEERAERWLLESLDPAKKRKDRSRLIRARRRLHEALCAGISLPAALRAHRYHSLLIGPMIVLLMCCMASGGFMLRGFGSYAHFQTAMLAFVAPWIFFVLFVMKSATNGYALTHVFIGNCIHKACIAVPLSRVIGALIQRWMSYDSMLSICTGLAVPWLGQGQAQRRGQGICRQLLYEEGHDYRTSDGFSIPQANVLRLLVFDDQQGYYWGIGMTTVLVALWQTYDLWRLIQRGRVPKDGLF